MNRYYEFAVIIGGKYADGTIKVAASDDEFAYDVAMEMVGSKLADAFPELDIEYSVELV